MWGAVLVALALFQRATPRELWPLVCPTSAATSPSAAPWATSRPPDASARNCSCPRPQALVPDRGRPLRSHHPPSGGPSFAALRAAKEGPPTAYSEHALDVAAVAGLLAKAGIGQLEAYSTEIDHKLPGRRSLFADLVLNDPGADPGNYRRGGSGRIKSLRATPSGST